MAKHSNSRHRKLKQTGGARTRELMGLGLKKEKKSIPHYLKRYIERTVFKKVQKLIHESSLSSLLPRPPFIENEAPDAMGLQLHFKSEFPSELYTRTNIPDVDVVLRKSNSEEEESTGLLSSIKVEMVILDGEFIKEDWTEEEFNDNIVEGRKGRGPLLIGDTKIELKDGICTFTGIKVTDNSHWTKCGFSLGVRVVQSDGVQGRIREARSKAIIVKDIRGKTSKKHASPSPVDEIWRLKNISKTGKYITELNGIGIKTVQELLRFSNTDPGSLKKIIKTKKTLDETLENAKKCTIDTKYYIYSSGEESKLLLNSIYDVVGVKFSSYPSFKKLDDLPSSLKYKVEILKRKAYKNEEKIEEYNEDPFFGPSKPQEVASFPETSALLNPQAITHLNEPASSSFSHPSNVPPQSHAMITPPQQQDNGDCFIPMYSNSSNMPTVCQQEVLDAIQDIQSSSLVFLTNQNNTSVVNDFSNEPFWDHMNFSPANGSTETFDSCTSLHENLDGWSDSGIQTGHASFHGSGPSFSVQLSGDFTRIALNWHVLKAILGLRMRMEKMVAAKRTDKID